MAYKRYNFSSYANKAFYTKPHQKSNLTHWSIETCGQILKIMYSLIESEDGLG